MRLSHIILPIFVFGLFILLPWDALAQVDKVKHVPLVNIPYISQNAGSGIGPYLNALFRISVSIAGILAVLMIIAGGFMYMTSEAVSGKSQGREYITSAILGLLLLLGTYLILYTINPQILSFKIGFRPLGLPPDWQLGTENKNPIVQREEDLARTRKACTDAGGVQDPSSPNRYVCDTSNAPQVLEERKREQEQAKQKQSEEDCVSRCRTGLGTDYKPGIDPFFPGGRCYKPDTYNCGAAR